MFSQFLNFAFSTKIKIVNAYYNLFMFKVISTQLQFLVQFLKLVDEHLSS